MSLSDFDYHLPERLIAQQPAPDREDSRLLVLERSAAPLQHRGFFELPSLLEPGDLLVFNDSKVLRARLRGVKEDTGGAVEIFMLAPETEGAASGRWEALVRPAKRVRRGLRLRLLDPHGNPVAPRLCIEDRLDEGRFLIASPEGASLEDLMNQCGEVPLPPYIRREGAAHVDRDTDIDRYQTVYARTPGSVAAPTAGLHFSERLLTQLEARGVRRVFVTLHVGLGTFAPVKVERLEEHVMHTERYTLSADTAAEINAQKQAGRRVIAVGTTAMRTLESAARPDAEGLGVGVEPGAGDTRLFIRPPHDFRIADGLITNFHLPKSTLLMLVSAFVQPGGSEGTARLLEAYREAIRRSYRFFSYGDAMLVL